MPIVGQSLGERAAVRVVVSEHDLRCRRGGLDEIDAGDLLPGLKRLASQCLTRGIQPCDVYRQGAAAADIEGVLPICPIAADELLRDLVVRPDAVGAWNAVTVSW